MKKVMLLLIASATFIFCEAQKRQPLLVRADARNIKENFRKALQFSYNKQGIRNIDEGYAFEKRTRKITRVNPGLKNANTIEVTEAGSGLQPVEKPTYSISPLVKINNSVSTNGGPDPMVAVGEVTVLVSNTHWVRFFNKSSGNTLHQVDCNDLFWQFVSPVIPGTSTPNPDYASNFYSIPKDVPYYCSKSKPCNVDNCGVGGYGSNDLPCPEKTDEGLINEAYDVRVYYQKEHKRFVIVAALRNQSSKDNDCYNAGGAIDCSQYLIRLVAVAVSASENPADGFYIYRTGENNYRDWPNAVIDQDYLVISNLGGGDDYTNGKSIVTVYDFRQMKDGVSGVIQGFTIAQNIANQTPGSLIPVSNFQTNQFSNVFFFLENNYLSSDGYVHDRRYEGKARIWYFVKPANAGSIFQNPPGQLKFAGEVSIEDRSFVGGAAAGISYYNGFIYYSSFQQFYDSTSTKRIGFGMHVMKIPAIKKSNGDYEVNKSSAAGFKHYEFKDENYSYLDVSIAVDAFHNMAINFIRLPRAKNSSEFPQVRCKVKFSNEEGWRASRLIKQWGNTSEGKEGHVHYSWIAKDPYSINKFWMSQAYRNNNSGGTWIDDISLGDF